MSHIVDPSLYRIGKNIYWNVLYPSCYKSIGMRLNLILNLTLISIFRMLDFRVIKIFISAENYNFKFLIIGFRLTKNAMITTDLVAIKKISAAAEPFLFLPKYFGDSIEDRTLLFFTSAAFKKFIKNEWVGTYGFKIEPGLKGFPDLDESFIEFFAWASSLELEYDTLDEKRTCALLNYVNKLIALLKKIDVRSLTANFFLKNSKNYFYTIFKKLFLISAMGLKVLKKWGYAYWFKVFNFCVKRLLQGAAEKELFSKKKASLFYNSSLPAFCNLYVTHAGARNKNAPKPEYARAFANNSFFAIYKILYVVALLKKFSKCKNFFIKAAIFFISCRFIKKTPTTLLLLRSQKLFKLKKKHRSLLNYKLRRGLISHSRPLRGGLVLKTLNNIIKNVAGHKLLFFKLASVLNVYFKKISKSGQMPRPQTSKSIVLYNFKRTKLKVFYKKIVNNLTSIKKKTLFNFKSFYLLIYSIFQNDNNFYNWILNPKISRKDSAAPVVNDWVTNKLFMLDLSARLSEIFSFKVELLFFSFRDALASQIGYNFFKNIRKYMSRVFIAKKEKFHMKMGLILSHFTLFYRVPELLVAHIIESLQYRVKHYAFVRPFSALLGLLNLKDYNLSGIKIGFYGRLNGRDRKFRYYIYKGIKPNILSLNTRIDYADAQSITRYGIVHIHIWLYNNRQC